MKRAFPWLFSVFAGVFMLFFAVQVVVLVPGVRSALAGYEGQQQGEFEMLARNILVNPTAEVAATLRYSNPFFVFSADGNLLYTNRGRGRSIPESDLLPVRYDGSVIGYYYAGEMRFLDNDANRRFLVTLIVLAGVSLVASIGLGLLVSAWASKRIAGPVRLLEEDIAAIESRSPIRSRSFSITELTGISESLEKLSTLLANEEEYKRQWMQDIAHDLRTPISGLKSQIEAMRDGVLEPSFARFARNLSEIERLQGLVEGISTLYAAENVHDLTVDEFGTREWIAELLAPHEVSRRVKRLEVETSISAPTIRADRALLSRAVGNIVSNAVAYVPAGGVIGIDVRLAGNDGAGDAGSIPAVEIVVNDSGPGVPVDQRERIFQRFFRGDYARNTPGTGLGLNIAKAIVERHGGTVRVQDAVPNGAVFVVRIPQNLTRR